MPQKETGYPQVDQALDKLDYTELSRLGKKGAARRKEIKETLKFLLTQKRLVGAAEAEQQANFRLCPIQD